MAKKEELATQEKAEVKLSFSDSLNAMLIDNREALPKDLNTARFVQNAVALLNGNETLQTFAQSYGTGQIKAGLLQQAFLGLDAISKEAYLVPYGNKLENMVSYKGACKLIKKYSVKPVKEVYAKVIRAGDEFEEVVVEGKPTINLKPRPFNDGAVIGAVAWVLFSDDTVIYETMSLAELEKTRSKSKMKNSMPWTEFTSEMYKKTVLRRLSKMVTIDLDNPLARQVWENDDSIANDVETDTTVIDVEDDVVDVEEVPQEIEMPDFLKE